MRQTNVAVCRWKELSIANTLQDIVGGTSKVELDGRYSLPTPKNFEYLLVRMQSGAKILTRIVYCARGAYDACQTFLEKAFFVETITLYLGVIANIWKNSVELCKKMVEYYNDFIRILRPHLVRVDGGSLAQELPDRLDEWLGDEWHSINVITSVPRGMRKKTSNLAVDITVFDNNDGSENVKTVNNDQGELVSAVVAMTDGFVQQKKRPKLVLKRKEVQPSGHRPSRSPMQSMAFNRKPTMPALDLGEALCRETWQSKKKDKRNY